MGLVKTDTINKVKIEALKAARRTTYFAVGSVYSKVLGENVYFNNHGFQHIMYDGNGRRRKNVEIVTRLNLLPCAPIVVINAKTSVDRVILAVDNKLGKDIVFYQLQHTIRSRLNPLRTTEVIVIVRKVGNGQLHFFSIRYGRKAKRK